MDQKERLELLEKEAPKMQSELDQLWAEAESNFDKLGILAILTNHFQGLPPLVQDCMMLVTSELTYRRARKLLSEAEANG